MCHKSAKVAMFVKSELFIIRLRSFLQEHLWWLSKQVHCHTFNTASPFNKRRYASLTL